MFKRKESDSSIEGEIFFIPIDDNSRKVACPCSSKNMVPLEAIIVPRVSLRTPDETDSILSASIRISPSSSSDER